MGLEYSGSWRSRAGRPFVDVMGALTLRDGERVGVGFSKKSLSSSTNLLLVGRFVDGLNVSALLRGTFGAGSPTLFQCRSSPGGLLRVVCVVVTNCFRSSTSSRLAGSPMFGSMLRGSTLTSRPAMSEFFGHVSRSALGRFLTVTEMLQEGVCDVRVPRTIVLSLSSALLSTCNERRNETFGFRCRDGNCRPLIYCSKVAKSLVGVRLHSKARCSYAKMISFLRPMLSRCLRSCPRVPVLLHNSDNFSAPSLCGRYRRGNADCIVQLGRGNVLHKGTSSLISRLSRVAEGGGISCTMICNRFVCGTGS